VILRSNWKSIHAYALKDTPIITVSALNVTHHAFLAMALNQHSASNVTRKRDILGTEVNAFRDRNAEMDSI